MEIFIGILLVTLAGIGTGTCAWPMKLMRTLKFEHFWFIGMLFGLVIVPWLIVLTQVSDPFGAYSQVGAKPLIIANLLSMGWGIANVLYGICVIRIGAALTGAILTALGVSVGALMPMIFKGSGLFSQSPDITSNAGLAVVGGVIVILLAVVFITLAGFGREKALKNAESQVKESQAAGGFLVGLILVIIAGVISCCISLCFVYSQGPIVEAMKANGAGNIVANVAVWAGALLGGALVNLLYPAVMMSKNKSWGMLVSNGRDAVLGAIIGIQFIIAIMLLGRGMLLLGALGASIGFGIQQAMQIMGNQAVGFISGEWRGVFGKPRSQMYLALVIIIIGVIILAYANTIK
jgi:L-rhamnose-H+ transport protein